MRYSLACTLLVGALVLDLSTRSAAASAPAPTPTPPPAVTVSGVYSIAAFHTYGINATGALDTATGADLANRADISSLLVTVNAARNKLSAAATVGAYAFPTLGSALDPTFQSSANAALFGALPLFDISYAPNAHLALSVGKLATLLGQESVFTYQNFNIERGIGWALEPTISRAARVTYANGRWNLALEDDDGYYSGHYGTFAGSIGYTLGSTSTLSFAAFVPPAASAPNPTTSIADKAEYDLMYATQLRKWNLQPYLLFVRSPASRALGYVRNERAVAAVLLGSYAASPRLSFGFRYENARNASSIGDVGANADLLGYGPGSAIQTFTLTPSYRIGALFIRAELARANLSAGAAGLGFGSNGNGHSQTRIGLEIGVEP
ncbi:MAG: outer membrane beta-barrel protein [Candidatus Baltobacteraceae bacterium]